MEELSLHHFLLLRLPSSRRALRSFLGPFLLGRNLGLGANGAKDEGDASPLHAREAVTKGEDGEGHGDHLAGDCDGDEEDRRKGGEGVD